MPIAIRLCWDGKDPCACTMRLVGGVAVTARLGRYVWHAVHACLCGNLVNPVAIAAGSMVADTAVMYGAMQLSHVGIRHVAYAGNAYVCHAAATCAG